MGANRIKIIRLILIILIFFHLIFYYIGCNKDEVNLEDAIAFKRAVKKYFRIAPRWLSPSDPPEDKYDGGVVEIEYNKDDIGSFYYRIYPFNIIKLDEEVGIELTDGIRHLFEEVKNLNIIIVKIYCPGFNQRSKLIWQPHLYFTISRRIYDSTNWNNFPAEKLLSICQDTFRHEK